MGGYVVGIAAGERVVPLISALFGFGVSPGQVSLNIGKAGVFDQVHMLGDGNVHSIADLVWVCGPRYGAAGQVNGPRGTDDDYPEYRDRQE